MSAPQSLLHGDLSGRVIGLYYDVYNDLGPSLPEAAYQRSMAIALTEAGLLCEREVPIQAMFRGHVVGEYRIDLVVERQIILECKTADSLSPNFQAQVRTYLKVSGLSLGLILLFGCKPAVQRVIYETARIPTKKETDVEVSDSV
jgi:GxxExxY protein